MTRMAPAYFLWAAFFFPAAASAQTAAAARQGDIQAQVRITGTVTASGIFRLKSTIEGRVAMASVSTFTWYDPSKVLGVLADAELTAILDAHGSTGNDILEERWQRIYKPTKIQCPSECFVLKSFIKPRQSIKPHAILIEAAKTLTLTGHVKLADCRWVKFNQPFEFWPVNDPAKKRRAVINHFEVAERDPKREPGGYISFDLSPGFYLDPGTEWEGIIHAEVKKNVLTVPTAALIVHDNQAYLPVAVSTGIGTKETTEIAGGLEENRRFLILDPSQMGSATSLKFALSPEPKALPPPVLGAPKAGVPKTRKKDVETQEPDPYEE